MNMSWRSTILAMTEAFPQCSAVCEVRALLVGCTLVKMQLPRAMSRKSECARTAAHCRSAGQLRFWTIQKKKTCKCQHEH